MTMSNADAVVRALFDGFNQRDLDAVAALASDDFVLEDVPAGLTLHGPQGLRQWLQGFLTAGPDGRAELKTVVIDGDWVGSEHVGTFTHTGPLLSPSGEIPATGRRTEIHMAEIYQVVDGKLHLLRAYYDLATMLRQLGLMPEPEPMA
ncbi:MAG: hypothetical protein PVSMB7_25810 [Chloroflexota bacterium]